MNRHHKRFLRRNKTAIAIIAVFSLTAFIGAFVADYYRTTNTRNLVSFAQKYEYTQYYVPIVHFTDSKDNVTTSELKDILGNKNSAYQVFVSQEDKENVSKILDLKELSGVDASLSTEKILDKVATTPKTFALLPFDQVNSRVKTLSVDGKFFWDKTLSNYPLKLKTTTTDKDLANGSFDKNKITLLTNIGDVILGRHVAYKMRTYNDYNHPWLKMADVLKRGDITFADLETPLSDRVTPPDEGMSFIAPQKSISGFLLSGVDIVALANNHSTNYGAGAFTDTLDVLKKNNIKYVGGGVNSGEAYSPTIIEKNSLKVAFLDFNSIVGAVNATEDTPGVAKFAIKPWAETDDETDLARIKANIASAKKQANLVVVEFHWGVEYEAKPIQSQINVAHAAIDAGADLVIGTHPHVVQAMESYKNVPIFYSLGNFIFDQEWSTETKQGFVAETYFYNKKLVSIKTIPYQIEDYNQPHLATEEQSKQIMSRIFGASLSSEYKN